MILQYKKLKSSKLTRINAKTLVMDICITSILSLIPSFIDEKKMVSAKVIINQGRSIHK